MAKLREKIGYAVGDAAAGGITWKVMSIAFPLFFTNVFGLTVADTATLMLIARMFDVVTDVLGSSMVPFRLDSSLRCCSTHQSSGLWASASGLTRST